MDSENSLDLIFDALSSKRRRATLAHLETHDEVGLRELADSVAEKEADGDADKDHRQTVYVALYQSHLPKLDDLDIIDFEEGDSDTQGGQTISTGKAYLEVARVMRAAERASLDVDSSVSEATA